MEITGEVPARADQQFPPPFPPGFVFGVSTSAYQIEGAVTEDGRGQSIWDSFCRKPGAVVGGDTGDVACDHYHRYQEDVKLVTDLGADAYRFSVSWPRVQPSGRGPANERGLDFYRRLVDELLGAGIQPFLTLYHFDLPQELEDRGGWRSRETAERFAEYASLVHGALGDRVPMWITVNEPATAAVVGYAEGRHAPGAAEGHGALAAAHHLLLGHGMAVQALRASGVDGERSQIGITLDPAPTRPVSPDPGDAAAATRLDVLMHQLFTDPVLAGRYPQQAREMYEKVSDFSFLRDGDMSVTSAAIDFLGVNYYRRRYAYQPGQPASDRLAGTAMDIDAAIAIPEGVELSEMDWPVEPDGLTELMTGLAERYPKLPPVYITENGRACVDKLSEDGEVNDPERIAYLASHLTALRDAIDAGVDIRGYFHWSLLDNFEWAEGYAKRFGLVHVDYATGNRQPKASYHWFRRYLDARR